LGPSMKVAILDDCFDAGTAEATRAIAAPLQ
jgi:hypothetical protein